MKRPKYKCLNRNLDRVYDLTIVCFSCPLLGSGPDVEQLTIKILMIVSERLRKIISSNLRP